MSKFGNHAVAGFDSKKEMRRYSQLVILQKLGKISNLKRQVSFELLPAQKINGKVVEHAVTYIADFVYDEHYASGDLESRWDWWRQVVEDVKSEITKKLPVYIIKRKLMLFVHKIQIKET
jgi:hypothetical protein